MEVDYTEKLNFSDDEENQAAKEKGENCVLKKKNRRNKQYFRNRNRGK